MKNQLTCFLIFLVILFPKPAVSQGDPVRSAQQADSLKQEIRRAKYDTTKIRLRYLIGVKTEIVRVSYWDSLLTDTRRYRLRRLEGRVLYTMARPCLISGEIDKGLACSLRSYEIAEQTGNTAEILSSLIYLSRCCYFKGDTKKALDCCYKGLKMAEALHDTLNIANLYFEEALCYFSNGQVQKSIALYLKCLPVYEKFNNEKGSAKTLMALGADYHYLKNDSIAAMYYLRCKKYAPRFGNGALGIEINTCLGSAYDMIKRYDSAQVYFRRAKEQATQIKSDLYTINIMIGIFSAYYHSGDNDHARIIGEQALRLSEKIHFKLQTQPLTSTLKEIYVKEKDYKKALEMQELFDTAKDSLESENNRKQALEKEFNYNLEKKEHENITLAQLNQIQTLELRQNKALFAGLSGVAVLIFIIAYLFFRQHKLRSEQESALLEQKLLRSQMNPHFIFNSLQAIQNMVLKEDKKRAESYLGSFASVMRNVLENSRMESIPLNKEIGLLENYLQLQKLRFGSRFDYEIRTDENIDPESVMIPPMLAQPFIENALEHGFHDIAHTGQISVSYALKNRMLLMEITDNGIGMKDNYTQSKKHRSLAIDITRERIALMNRSLKEKASFSIGEAFPLAEHKGVKVTFILPLI